MSHSRPAPFAQIVETPPDLLLTVSSDLDDQSSPPAARPRTLFHSLSPLRLPKNNVVATFRPRHGRFLLSFSRGSNRRWKIAPGPFFTVCYDPLAEFMPPWLLPSLVSLFLNFNLRQTPSTGPAKPFTHLFTIRPMKPGTKHLRFPIHFSETSDCPVRCSPAQLSRVSLGPFPPHMRDEK